MATHSRTLAWRIPWTEEPGGYSVWCHKESDMTEQLSTHAILLLWDFLGKNIGMGCHFLLQGIFLTQGSNPHPISHIS